MLVGQTVNGIEIDQIVACCVQGSGHQPLPVTELKIQGTCPPCAIIGKFHKNAGCLAGPSA